MPSRSAVAAVLIALAGAALAQNRPSPAPPARPSAVLSAGTDATLLAAREALRRKDGPSLLTARDALQAAGHPLAGWAAYWELRNRLAQASQADLDAFYARWPGTYVEDRLRNDWLLELGKRRDWVNLRTEFPRFRMNDDREVTCYALLARHLEGQDVQGDALAAWRAQPDVDDGCQLLAATMAEAGRLPAAEAWAKARLSTEANRPRGARAAAALVSAESGEVVAAALEEPARHLAGRAAGKLAGPGHSPEADLLALMRLAAGDPEAAATALQDVWAQRLGAARAATAWAHVGRQAALKQLPLAALWSRQAWQVWDGQARVNNARPPWSDELLAWQVRAALRQGPEDRQRWPLISRAIAAMSPEAQRDDAWVYWGARARLAQAEPGAEGDAARAAAQAALQGIARQMSFYGKLAGEALGQGVVLPPAPAPLSAEERAAPRRNPGFARALQLIALGLRSEGVREWNFTLRGLADRELLAAAHWACEREVWDRCINTSERTRAEVDLTQRFPLPLRAQVAAQARASGLEPALLYGLIRQESRFVTDARSGVGASGLMQLMPATARWMARKLGHPYSPAQINDHETNLLLGASYLRRLVDDFDGSLAMATAAYNAGPGRPRRWREGPLLEAAAWAETIPFNETRDYVKKVLSNSVYYAAVMGQPVPTLSARLGPPVGPRDPAAPAPDRSLP